MMRQYTDHKFLHTSSAPTWNIFSDAANAQDRREYSSVLERRQSLDWLVQRCPPLDVFEKPKV
jgi:hypothetical protein